MLRELYKVLAGRGKGRKSSCEKAVDLYADYDNVSVLPCELVIRPKDKAERVQIRKLKQLTEFADYRSGIRKE